MQKTSVTFVLLTAICGMCAAQQTKPETGGKAVPFSDRFLPVPVDSGFRMPGFDVWCGSVIKGEDNRYHMFASRWPKGKGYNWALDSEVVRASSDTPEGPYRFEEVVLPKRGTKYWDGMVTHNPTIHKYKDTYVLFYTGTTYTEREYSVAWANKRIGIATATSVKGPWTRRDAAVLQPRPGKWDSKITSNAAPCILPDGRVVLVYKSRFDTDLRLGVALADNFEGPYRHVSDEAILSFPSLKNSNAEDAYVWHEKDGFHMLYKVFDTGEFLVGEKNAGAHAVSPDGVNWKLAGNPKGYSRTIRWADGRTETMPRVERVQLLIQDGVITHAIFAVLDNARNGYNIVIPCKREDAR